MSERSNSPRNPNVFQSCSPVGVSIRPLIRLYAIRASFTLVPSGKALVQLRTPVLAFELRVAVFPPLAGRGRLPGSSLKYWSTLKRAKTVLLSLIRQSNLESPLSLSRLRGELKTKFCAPGRFGAG